MQCAFTIAPFISISVPGVHTFMVVRLPARNCASTEMGQSWSFRIVSGACEWTITPLLSRRVRRGHRAHLLAEEPVLEGKDVVRELLFVEEMAEPRAELAVFVVHNPDGAVLHAKRVGVVVAQVVMGELHHPTVEISAVEDRLPVLRGRRAPVGRGRLRKDQKGEEAGQQSHGVFRGVTLESVK